MTCCALKTAGLKASSKTAVTTFICLMITGQNVQKLQIFAIFAS